MRHHPLFERAVGLTHDALARTGDALAKKGVSESGDGKLRLDRIQIQSFELARFLSMAAAAEAIVLTSGEENATSLDERLAALYASETVTSIAKALHADHLHYGLKDIDPLEEFFSVAQHLKVHCAPDSWVQLGREILDRESGFSGSTGFDPTHNEFREMFARFADSVIAPLAEKTHREDRIVPDSVLKQLADIGAFGISIPEEFGGCFSDHGVMVIATEELSRASLGAGGSVLTRPEICAKALMSGGTDEQKKKWLPLIATGQKMVCIAVTEPNTGSDVASVSLSAKRVDGGYVLNGEKTWATFAGRSEILCVLARTGATELGHKGLSLFIVEKPYQQGDEYNFTYRQENGGLIEGHAIPTIGYRGMHSFSISFEDYFVPAENLIGQEGQGFYLQMQGFAGGRIQTAARAVGVMEAALRAAVSYVKSRKAFRRTLAEFEITRFKIARMAATVQANRQLTLRVAGHMDRDEGSGDASLVKLLACKDAEWVTREAMQLHGGMGYSEEYPVSRYYVDARVLSIFEGAEEILALQVIARPFLQKFLEAIPA